MPRNKVTKNGDEVRLPNDFILEERCDIGSFAKSANDKPMLDSLWRFPIFR